MDNFLKTLDLPDYNIYLVKSPPVICDSILDEVITCISYIGNRYPNIEEAANVIATHLDEISYSVCHAMCSYNPILSDLKGNIPHDIALATDEYYFKRNSELLNEYFQKIEDACGIRFFDIKNGTRNCHMCYDNEDLYYDIIVLCSETKGEFMERIVKSKFYIPRQKHITFAITFTIIAFITKNPAFLASTVICVIFGLKQIKK